MEVKIIRSRRRRRSVGARLVDDVLLVNAPLLIPQGRLDEIINDFKLKFARQKIKASLDQEKNLLTLAKILNKEYFNNELKINAIEYTTNQNTRYGCCNYRTAKILISHKIGLMPNWVRKYVLLHEMAHLIQPNHGRQFRQIVARYKLAERARGYLMAISQGQSS